MNRKWLAGGLGLGSGLMYLLDPAFGRRRRAILRDKLVRAGDTAEDAITIASRDLANRARGVVAESRARLRREQVSDEVLAERVRSKVGRAVSHPGAIEVSAREGLVTLSGPVLREEMEELLAHASSVRGVKEVVNRLEPHANADGVPALQGGEGRRAPAAQVARSNWPPGWRLVTGLAGGGLAAWGLRRRNLTGAVAASGGALLLTRAATNLEWKRLLGIGPGLRGIDIHKTLHVNAPVEEVFAFWSRVENFPKFLSHVRAVRDNGQGCSHWEVEGPAGTTVAWNAAITAYVPGQLVAWKTSPGEPIRHSGIVRFDPNLDGSTRLDIRMTYKPPAWLLGHAIATLFATDPKTTIDEDLMRFKSLLETGKSTAHGEQVRAEEVAPREEEVMEPTPRDLEEGAPPTPRPPRSRRRTRRPPPVGPGQPEL